MQLSSSLLLYVDVACLLLVLALLIRQRQDTPSTQPLIILLISGAYWICAHAFSLIQTQQVWSMIWQNLSAIGLVYTPLAWLGFALIYSNNFHRIRQPWLPWLSIIPILVTMSIIINSVWIFRSSNLDHFQATLFLFYAPELAYFFTSYSIVSYLCICIGSALLVYNAFTAPKFQRKQAILIAIAAIIPAIGDLIYFTLASHVPYMTIIIISISISALLITWGLIRYRLFQIVPIAHDKVIEDCEDGIIVYNRFFHILNINPAAQKLVSQQHSTWIDPQQQNHANLQSLIQTFHHQGISQAQAIYQNQSSQTNYTISISPLYDHVHRISAHIVTLHDNSTQQEFITNINKLQQEIQQLRSDNEQLTQSYQQAQTDRTQIELELQHSREASEIANRTKQRFLANMNHELRTPLTAILGYAELIQLQAQYTRNPQLGHDIKLIYTSGKHLLSLIDDLLDITQLESEQIELQISAFDIAAQIDTLVEALHTRATKRNNQIIINYSNGLGSMVSDLKRVRQILFNILDNAIKFTEEGQITWQTRIETDAKDPGIEYIIFEISDTGIGISPVHQQMIFQEFTQVDNSGTRKYEGAGIGLAISQRLAHMLGGDISLNSTLGVGSTFVVRLPRQIKQ